MSRIGKQPIQIPSGVTMKIAERLVTVSGPKGEVSVKLPPKTTLTQQAHELTVSVAREQDSRQAAFWGLARSLVANAVQGVSEGFARKLEVNGVGYKVQLKDKTLVLNVGYSHPVTYTAPDSIDFLVQGNAITVSGIDKQLVGEVAARIRRIRKPEPYKGKGIKYADEVIRRKAGKMAKGAES